MWRPWRCSVACAAADNLNFWDAVQWLAPHAGVSLAENIRRPSIDRRSGAKQFVEWLRGGSDEQELERIAAHRGFEPDMLRRIGASVYDLTRLRREASTDRALEEALCKAGILRAEAAALPDSETRNWLRGFYSGKRIVFPLGSQGDAPVGFAARALGNEDPRYLYSFDFPRRDTLYGAERVEAMLSRRELRGNMAYIYVVEEFSISCVWSPLILPRLLCSAHVLHRAKSLRSRIS